MSPATELNQGIYFATSWKLTYINLTALFTWHKSHLSIMTLNHYALTRLMSCVFFLMLIHPCYNVVVFFCFFFLQTAVLV